MTNISEKVIKKIKAEEIKVRPKWHFLLKSYVIWGLFGISILIGSFAFSLILYILQSQDWEIYTSSGRNGMEYVLLILPYFWIITLGIFSIIAYYNFHNTANGYKYKTSLILISSVVISLALGIVFNIIGFSSRLDSMFARNLPFIPHSESMMATVWTRPEDGLLSGEILEINSAEEIVIKDFQNKVWIININDSTLIRGRARISVGEKIKMIGKVKGQNTFLAEDIRPWMGIGMMNGGGGRMMGY